MNNKYFAVTVTSVLIAIVTFIYLMLFMTIASDLKNKVIKLEKENQELRWQNRQTTMYCEVE